MGEDKFKAVQELHAGGKPSRGAEVKSVETNVCSALIIIGALIDSAHCVSANHIKRSKNEYSQTHANSLSRLLLYNNSDDPFCRS